MRSILLPLALLSALLAGCATTPAEEDPVQQQAQRSGCAHWPHRARRDQIEVAGSQRLDELQAKLSELRGRIEELENSNETLRKQQRDLYADLDKRLGRRGRRPPARRSPGLPGRRRCGCRSADVAPETGPSSTDQAAYNQAFDALKAGNYAVAITGFKEFLATYPQSSLADNAQYWLGESYYVTRDYDRGRARFARARAWPDSRKAPDALLKLGYTQYEQKQHRRRSATLTDVDASIPAPMRRSSPPRD